MESPSVYTKFLVCCFFSVGLVNAAWAGDTTAPVLTQVTPIKLRTNDTTPSYTFSSTEGGILVYGGACKAAATTIAAPVAPATTINKTLTFNALAAGTYSNCTVQVGDVAGNVSAKLTIPAFTIDITKPALATVMPVKATTPDTTPSYTFSSTETGSIIYGGVCKSTQTVAIQGNNTVTFNALVSGTYSSCTVQVKDMAGNISLAKVVNTFTVTTPDIVKPVLAVVTAVKTFTNDQTPSYSFSSTEAGTIIYGGACQSPITVAIKGNNILTFNTLAAGTYSNCSISVKDAAGNISLALTVNPFTIDLTRPVLSAVIQAITLINYTRPSYTFGTTEGGTIIYGGACKATTTTIADPVILGAIMKKILTFNALAAGTYSNCTLQVRDAAGNLSLALRVNTFTIDLTAPVLTLVTAIPATINDPSPNFTFSSTESGSLIFGGSCSSATILAYLGSNVITLKTLPNGLYNNCTITVKDAANNMSTPLAIPAFTVATMVASKPLNDTGITRCTDEYAGSNITQNTLSCSATGTGKNVNGIDAEGDLVPAGQDALYGRDANPATNSDTDGMAGFSFTKLDANGTALAFQGGYWKDAGSESDGTKWSCIKDNVTGLIWEVKTNDGGLRDKDWTYSWFNNNNTSNGGLAGYADYGDNCYVKTRCDTTKYVEDVNAINLCGETANNWRLPTQSELLSIVANNRVNPSIDAFFVHAPSSYFWTASPLALKSRFAWFVNFGDGSLGGGDKSSNYYIRLVRSSQ